MSENDLIKRAQQGDRAAFAEVVEDYYDTIFRFAMKYTAERSDAEDITHQVCIKLGQSIQSFRFESEFSTWLYTLVLNGARDWSRKNKRLSLQNHVELTEEDLAANSEEHRTSPNSDAENLIQLRQVLERVAEYGNEFLETLELVSGEGMSHAEAASLLAVKESTISWRIHEIRKRLAAENLHGETP